MAKTQARKKAVAKAAPKLKVKGGPKAAPKRSAAKKPTAKAGGKYVYRFGRKTDGNGSMKALLGGKGANLAEMSRIGLPVPPGFTITTEVCTYFYANKRTYPPQLKGQMEAGIAAIEQQTGKKFGDLKNPLLVSVRSGARDSMPGMMDTILNLGLNDQTVEALATKTGNARFAWDCYRRFVQMYGDVVMGVQKRPDEDHEPFETVIDESQARAPSPGHRRHEALGRRPAGARAPLQGAGEGAHRQELPGVAVGSADGRGRRRLRLVDERPRDRLPPQVQHPDRVGHRRQRAGDGLRQHRRRLGLGRRVHAQPGQRRERVLRRVPHQRAGRRRRRRRPHAGTGGGAEEADAEGLRRARTIRQTLEKHFKDVQDFEFTIQDGIVFMLQTRNGKRTAMAALKFSMDMFKEKLIDWKTAIMRNPGRPARPVARADLRCRRSGEGEGDRHGPAGRSGRGVGPDLSQRRSRGGGGRQGREGAARPHRNVAGRSARHDRGRRHPHRARRRVVARGARRPADGQGLRLRRRGGRSRLPGEDGDGRGPDVQGRRLDLDRRHGRARSTPARSRPRRRRSSPA